MKAYDEANLPIMAQSRRFIKQKYGRDFWTRFRSLSKLHLNEILPKVPDIGKSIFSFN